jgi:hypothetical protein
LTAVGKVGVVIERADSATVRDVANDFVNAGLDESFTVTVTGKLPPVVGIPVMTPVLAVRLSPPGSFPVVIDQLNADLPPVAASALV